MQDGIPVGTLTLQEINQLNSEFWRVEQQRMEARMADDAIRDTALETLATDIQKGASVQRQTSLYEALADAERVWGRFVSQHSRKGGCAKKTDALQEVIEEFVRGNHAITQPQLLEKLTEHQDIHPIQEIDEGVIFFTTHDGRTKQAQVSGLKDRLRRAKQKLGSRQPGRASLLATNSFGSSLVERPKFRGQSWREKPIHVCWLSKPRSRH